MPKSKTIEERAAPTRCVVCPVRNKALFQVVADEYLAEAQSRRAAQYHLPPRTELYRESAAADMGYTVYDGWLLLYRTHSDGSRQGLHVALPGDFIGYAAVTNHQYTHSAMAITDAIVCGFTQADLHEMIDGHPSIARHITAIQGDYLQTCETNVLALGRKSAEQRIAYVIADLYHRLDQRGDVDRHQRSMPFPLTQEMLGELTGLTSVHTNRVLRRLRGDGIMASERQRIAILDLPRLHEVAEFRVNHLA